MGVYQEKLDEGSSEILLVDARREMLSVKHNSPWIHVRRRVAVELAKHL